MKNLEEKVIDVAMELKKAGKEFLMFIENEHDLCSQMNINKSNRLKEILKASNKN